MVYSKYAKVVNGKLEYSPIELYTNENIVIPLETHEDLISKGYKIVVSKKPLYDKNLYELVYVGFLESNYEITLQYELREKVVNNILDELLEIFEEKINE